VVSQSSEVVSSEAAVLLSVDIIEPAFFKIADCRTWFVVYDSTTREKAAL
jgi:hypothetical protein